MFKFDHAYKPLLALLLFSLAWKLFLMSQVEVINVDGARYLVAVNHLLEGDFMLSMKLSNSPLYLASIAVLKTMVGDAILAGLLLSALSAAFLVVPLYLVILRLADQPAAFWGSAALVLSPWYNEYSHEIVRGPLFLFLFMWGVWFALRALDNQRARDFLFCGLFVFLASMIRIEGVIFYPLFLIYLAISVCRQVGFKSSFVYTVSFLLMPLIGLIVFFVYTGLNPLFVQQTVQLADFSSFEFMGTFQQVYAKFRDIDEAFPEKLGGKGSYNIFALARHYMPLLYLVGLLEAVGKILFPLFILPLILGLKHAGKLTRDHRFVVLLAISYFGMAFFLIVYKNWISHRYVQIVPLLLYPLIGLGFVTLLKNLSRPLAGKLICLFLVMCLVLPLYKSFSEVENKDLLVKQAGTWLGTQPELNSHSLFCEDLRIPFYAGRGLNFVRQNSEVGVKRIFDVAERKKVDLVVLETQAEDSGLPRLNNFEVLKEFSEGNKKISIYLRNRS